MPYVARTKTDRAKLTDNVARGTDTIGVHNLKCGHQTNRTPLVTGRRSLYLCPICGELREAR